MTDGAARRLAEALDGRGLREPARLLVDAHRPLAPLLGDLAVAIGPLAGMLRSGPVDDLRALLERPRGLDQLADELAQPPPRGPRAESR